MTEDRVVLDGVDHYRVMEPLFEGIRVVLSYRGESYSPAYVQGISGAAFRIGGICPCAPTCTAAMATQDLPKLFGYETTFLPLYEDGIDLTVERAAVEGGKVVTRVKEEIRAGRPVVVWHAFTTAEWDAVTGFDEGQNQFLGRGSYAGIEDYAAADQMRLATCLEICPAFGAILIGEKTGAFDAGAAEVAALREAVTHARTRKAPKPGETWLFLEGIQCYDRWVDDLKADPASVRTMGSKYCWGVYRSTHGAANDFLLELAPKYPQAADELRRAAQAFETDADALDACKPYMSWEAPDTLTPEQAESALRLLSRARDAYSAGFDHIEAALAKL